LLPRGRFTLVQHNLTPKIRGSDETKESLQVPGEFPAKISASSAYASMKKLSLDAELSSRSLF
jgi:hypothetical protein